MFTRSSDAHQPDVIGTAPCYLKMETRSFDEIRKALHGEDGREVLLTLDH
jgi:PHP family Zn ribbon phosphoesterase